MTIGVAALVVALQTLGGAAAPVAPDAQLVAEARADAIDFRERVIEALEAFVRADPGPEARRALDQARRLAAAHAAAWRDPYLPQRVERLAGWSRERRLASFVADSLRRAGVDTFGREGPAAASALWRESVQVAMTTGDTAAAAAAIANIGAALLRQGKTDDAERHFERARQLARAVGERRVEANASGALASILAERGDYAGARGGYDASLTVRHAIGDARGAAADLNNLGLLALQLGDIAGARAHFEEALALNRGEGRDDVAATNLLNLATVLSIDGEFTRASALLREALAIYRAEGLAIDAADALAALGQVELRRGDYRAAAAAFDEAGADYLDAELHADAIGALRQLAVARAATGELQDALNALRDAARVTDSVDVPLTERAALLLSQGDLALVLNAVEQAGGFYYAAQRLYQREGNDAGAAEARQGRGLVALAREDWDRARQLFEDASRTQQAHGLRRAAATTLVLLAHAHARDGDTITARGILENAIAELAQLDDPVAQAAALGELATLEADAGNTRAADSLFTLGLEQLASRPAPDIAWQLLLGRGLARRSAGATDAGVRDLAAAVEQIETMGATLRLAQRRAAFRADKEEAYAQLALSERRRGRPDAAFRASERLRAQQMLELLARGRVQPPPRIAGELAVREQDLRRRIAELARAEVVPAGTSTRDAGSEGPDGSAAALTRLRDAYAELLLEMRERAPDDADLVAATPPAWRDVARRLPRDAAMIEYLVSDSGVVAFVLTRDTVAVLDLGLSRVDLARLVEFARAMVEDPASRERWRAPFARLHRHLIEPLEGTALLKDAGSLVLVPHLDLHYLPFAALLDEQGRFLVERYRIEYTPSAAVWLALGDRGPSDAARQLLVLAPTPQALPGSAREARAVAATSGPGADARVGAAASETAFRAEAAEYRVLHLATSGVLVKDSPLFSYVELAPGGGHDGRLEVHEVFGLTLRADLVVLSACETGLGSGALADVPAGDDWVGLSRAFLHAGARQVAATLWAVEDASTAALMQSFHQRRVAGAASAVALAEAQRTMLRREATSHPYHWAGLSIVSGAP